MNHLTNNPKTNTGMKRNYHQEALNKYGSPLTTDQFNEFVESVITASQSTPPVSAMEDETENIFKPYCIDFFSKESEEERKIKIDFAFSKKDEAFAIFQSMYHDDYGSVNIDENLVSIHTGGWSENEYLISIFKKTEWWRQNFRIQITGGHYYFDTDRINGIKEWDITKRITTPTK